MINRDYEPMAWGNSQCGNVSLPINKPLKPILLKSYLDTRLNSVFGLWINKEKC